MKNEIFMFEGNIIKPGTKHVILFPSPNINTQITIDIPVHIFHGKLAGPKIFITSAIHGDELNSIEIIRRVHEYLYDHHLSGTVITVPVVNVHGVIMQTRYMVDRRDLNRSFPGSKKGTLASRLANALLQKVVTYCQYGIDLHTGAYGRVNMPQLRVDFTTAGAKEFALSFNTPVVIDSKQRDGSLRQAASDLGIPLLVYEAGEALRYNELCIRAGVNGILNTLKYLKMLKIKNPLRTKKIKPVITNASSWVRAPVSGLVQPIGEILSRQFEKGAVLAHIHDPFLINPSIKVIAPFKGIVIGQALKIMVTEGDALYHIARFKKLSKVRASIEVLREEIMHEE